MQEARVAATRLSGPLDVKYTEFGCAGPRPAHGSKHAPLMRCEFLVQKFSGKSKERLHILKIRDHADRDAHRPAVLAVNAQPEIVQ